MRLLLPAVATLALLAFSTPAVASADSSHHSDTHILVDFPKDSPGHNKGGKFEVSVCPFSSFDDLQNHYDSDKTSKVHDDIDKAFADAIKIDGKSQDDAFDVRHKDCPDKHHDSSSSHHETQTKVVPRGSVDAGDGSTDTG